MFKLSLDTKLANINDRWLQNLLFYYIVELHFYFTDITSHLKI